MGYIKVKAAGTSMSKKIILEKKISEKLSELRTEYTKSGLTQAAAEKNPFAQFAKWLNEAISAEIIEPNAMLLATATPEGAPSVRTVLLKEFSEEEGFLFYTNYLSRKGEEIEKNPKVALLFYWAELERQIRIEGSVKKSSRENAEEYFASRPRGAQIASAVSQQSLSIKNRAELEANFKAAEEEYKGKPIPCPPHWGGYIVKPSVFEFWQGRPDRSHDRIQYRASGTEWEMRRLSP